jgi:polyribonucleotide nucleotidyltransferase
MQRQSISVDVAGKTLIFETGAMARQANGAVMVRCGDTVVFASACASSSAPEGIDFFPLRVDYQEKFSAVGRTAGGFLKREGKPSEREVLTSRLIDRPIRPMFPDGFFNEVQLLAYCFSYDQQHLPDVMAITACSAALVISDIPLVKPIAGARVGRINGEFVVNPTVDELKRSDLDLVLAGTEEAILMIEGSCQFLTEHEVLQAIEAGHMAIRHICRALATWREHVGKPKMSFEVHVPSQELMDAVRGQIGALLPAALKIKGKADRDAEISRLDQQVLAACSIEEGAGSFTSSLVNEAVKRVRAEAMREMILRENLRCDGRTTTQIRPIFIEMAVMPRTHGSTLFTRGETQALAICTLGGESSGQRFEDLHGEGLQRFYLQYSFPPFSVGEVGRVGAPGRREVGHGKLAERALQASAPSLVEFPYTIRLESNILESNGSSSMASVCGGCLAMMDAGVPIRRPVAGIAMGLILEKDRFAILSDILGAEDALGDMDFKVAGDHEGITAFQMDIKVEGITLDIMKAALSQAREGRSHILNKMLEVCPAPRQEMASHAPRIEQIRIKPSQIGMVIGPGGKQIRAIIEASGAEIDINDEGIVSIASNNADSMAKARQMVLDLTSEVEVGKTYQGEVASVVDFGVFVKIFGKEYLCHVSELAWERVEHPKDLFKEGDAIEVKVIGQNDRGQLKLSRKVLLPKPEGYVEPPRREFGEGRGDGRHEGRGEGRRDFRRDGRSEGRRDSRFRD